MVRLGEQAAGEALQQAVRSACANAKVNPAQLTRTVAGVAGVGRAEIRDSVQHALRQVVAGNRCYYGCAGCIAGCFCGWSGVVVVAGTGLSRSRGIAGRDGSCRGWGWPFPTKVPGPGSDGRWWLRFSGRVMRACAANGTQYPAGLAARGPPTSGVGSERHAAAGFWGASAGSRCRGQRRRPMAVEVFLRAGRELAALAQIAASRVFAADATSSSHVRRCVRSCPNLREAFYNSLQTQLPNATLLPDSRSGAWSFANGAPRLTLGNHGCHRFTEFRRPPIDN